MITENEMNDCLHLLMIFTWKRSKLICGDEGKKILAKIANTGK